MATVRLCILAVGAALLTAGVARAAAPALVTLADGDLRATIAPDRGGVLSGLQVCWRGRWRQLLYRGDDFTPTKDFAGKAPILWPATGRNFLPASDPQAGQAAWRWNGTVYPMTIHGFARDLPWTLQQPAPRSRATRAALTLTDTAETRARYPFRFKFTSEYNLIGDTLTIRQTIHASEANAGPMPFSIGNHVTFNLPLAPGSDIGAVTFATAARTYIQTTDAAALPTGRFEAAHFAQPQPIASLKTRASIALGDYAATPSVRIHDPAGLDVTVSHVESKRPAGVPVLFNLWGDPKAGFFSPEPWVGKANSLVTGDGLVELRPGEDFEWAITIRVTAAPEKASP